MRLNCFRASSGFENAQHDINAFDDQTLPNKPRPAKRSSSDRTAKTNSKGRYMRRHNSAISDASSNPSISQLPPCRSSSQVENAAIDALMMPVPYDARPSRCLRLSHPRIYTDIVESMKVQRGGRDWRNFTVFGDDEIDESRSAVKEAEKKAKEYEKKFGRVGTFSSGEHSRASDEFVDMIG